MKKSKITKNTIIGAVGVIFALLALITCLSQYGNNIFRFLSDGLSYLVGFIGFWLITVFVFILGVYMILKRQLLKIRFDIVMWGLFIAIFASLLIFTYLGSKDFVVKAFFDETQLIRIDPFGVDSDGHHLYIELSSFSSYYHQIKDSTAVSGVNIATGGGILGFLFVGLLNGIHPLFTAIFSWLILILGLCLVFNRQMLRLFKFIKRRHLERKELKKQKALEASFDHCDTSQTPYNFDDENNDTNFASNANVSDETMPKDNVIISPSPMMVQDKEFVPIQSSVSQFSRNDFDNHDNNNENNFNRSQHENINQNVDSDLSDIAMKTYNSTHVMKKAVFVMNNQNEEKNDINFGSNIKKLEINDRDNDSTSFENVNSRNITNEVNETLPQQEPSDIQINNSYQTTETSIPNIPNIDKVSTQNNHIPSNNVGNNNDNIETANNIEQNVGEKKIDEKNFIHMPQPKAVVKNPYILPPITLLDNHEQDNNDDENHKACDRNVAIINQSLTNLRAGAHVVGYTIGPSVTRYDLETDSDVSIRSIGKYINDISIKLGGVPVRFEEIVFGKTCSGLEIPNSIRTNVGLRESIEQLGPGEKNIRDIPFGKNISGTLMHERMDKFPHMLVAGTTGSGKSIFAHCVITTLLMRNTPDQLKLLLVDPKKVEMNYYEDIPHLLCPPINDPQKALVAFKKLVEEMERRYNLFKDSHVREIGDFNKIAKEKSIVPLPYIVVFIDEYADLNEECKEIREPIVRIAQKARAAGIHLVIATQRPSVNVIDGVIKANIQTKVALKVALNTDSMTILGTNGAEKLLGNGDAIIDCISIGSLMRVQSPFVSEAEITRVCEYWKNNYGSEYDQRFMNLEEPTEESIDTLSNAVVTQVSKDASEDELYNQIKEDIVTKPYCSISYIQRSYGVGFPKAGRLFKRLQIEGYVAINGDARGSKVLVHEDPNQNQQLGSIEQSTFIPSNDNNQPESSHKSISNEIDTSSDDDTLI